jgi:hypothetical protein
VVYRMARNGRYDGMDCSLNLNERKRIQNFGGEKRRLAKISKAEETGR